jgi:hypothetical protein
MRVSTVLSLSILNASCAKQVPIDTEALMDSIAERYRAYRINYVVGEDLVKACVQHENPSGDAAEN